MPRNLPSGGVRVRRSKKPKKKEIRYGGCSGITVDVSLRTAGIGKKGM